MQIGKDLVAASAAPLVLGILAEGDNYGYAILQRIAELSGGRPTGAKASSIPSSIASSGSSTWRRRGSQATQDAAASTTA